jgi:ComF family protein
MFGDRRGREGVSGRRQAIEPPAAGVGGDPALDSAPATVAYRARLAVWDGFRRRVVGKALLTMFPPTCVLCGAAGQDQMTGLDLCSGCAADLPMNRSACPRCALPFETHSPSGTLCAVCQRRPPPFDLGLAAFRYAGAVPSLIGDAKFRGHLNVARLLGQLLAERLRTGVQPHPDVIVPVPLHPARQRQRGYNQALEIARIVGRELALPVDPGILTRILPTPPQTGLAAPARRRNLRGAFRVAGEVRGRHLAVLDDVVTTGSTVREIGAVLRAAGAQRIQIWAVARTP